MSKPKRRFVVWLDKNIAQGGGRSIEVLEFPANASKKRIDTECADCLDAMIANGLDTGWQELAEGEEPDEGA